MAVFMPHKAVIALVLVACSSVVAQDPFITYNKSVPIGQAGFVRWNTNSFAAPVNLWLQQLAPNASAPQVPLDYSNTKGFFLWDAGSNLNPGQYFYQLQSVGGNGIIFKSNPIMVLCSECSVESSSQPPSATDATTAMGADGQPVDEASVPVNPAGGGHRLSPGAAAGVGAGGTLLLVAIIGVIFFLFRRARKRKHNLHQPPFHSVSSTQHPSVAPISPPPQFSSPYEPPPEVKMAYPDPPPIALGPQYGQRRGLSHELDSAAVASNPRRGAYRAQSEGTMAERLPSPQLASIIAAQPNRPPPMLRSNGSKYHRSFQDQVLPSQSSQGSPEGNHDNGSYGFPSHEASPDPDVEGFQFQQHHHHRAAGSPESQQRLFSRRAVGSPNQKRSR